MLQTIFTIVITLVDFISVMMLCIAIMEEIGALVIPYLLIQVRTNNNYYPF